MSNRPAVLPPPVEKARINRNYCWLLVLWTALVASLCLYVCRSNFQNILETAEYAGWLSYQKDLAYRRWVAFQGGVYVAASSYTPPNPFLEGIPGRDIKSQDGSLLTLMNPAYMTRQVHQLSEAQYGWKGHITRLHPLNPDNAPDSWEREALASLESTRQPFKEISSIEGQDYFRQIYPLAWEKKCLGCHKSVEYQEGDVCGGISISIPMKVVSSKTRDTRNAAILSLSCLWLIGTVGMLASRRRAMALGDDLCEYNRVLIEKDAALKETSRLAKMGGFLLDPKAETLEMSGAGLALFEIAEGKGLSLDELLGMTACTARGGAAGKMMREAMSAGLPFDVEADFRLASGRTKWLRLCAEPAEASESAAGYHGYVRDISDRKKMEILKEDVDKLFKHDIRSPLSGIVHLPLLMEGENLTPEQRAIIDAISQAGRRVLGMINMSRDMHRIEDGSYAVQISTIDLGGMIESISMEQLKPAQKKNLGIRSDFPDGSLLRADHDLLYTMLSNLIVNAVEASPAGAAITVRMTGQDSRIVTIHNMGVIPEPVRESFFEKYSTSGKPKGTGLGTYSAKLIADVHGGHIGFTTSEREGTTIRIEFPNQGLLASAS
jgi:signal transduction histidine kinase